MIFKGIITSVLDDRRIVVKVDDDDIANVTARLTIRTKISKIYDYITLNIKSAKFNIKNLDWESPKDLIGVQMHWTCNTRPYDFTKKIKYTDDFGNEKKGYSRFTGITIYATQVHNILK